MDETKLKEPALARMRAILFTMIEDNCSPKTASEIAQRSDTPLSSAIRNLDNLCAIGWAEKRGEYYLIGHEIIAVSHAFFLSCHHAVIKIKQDMAVVESHAHALLDN